MIVVMDYGDCGYIHGTKKGETRDEFGASFGNILLRDIIPFVEKTFRVKQTVTIVRWPDFRGEGTRLSKSR